MNIQEPIVLFQKTHGKKSSNEKTVRLVYVPKSNAVYQERFTGIDLMGNATWCFDGGSPTTIWSDYIVSLIKKGVLPK